VPEDQRERIDVQAFGPGIVNCLRCVNWKPRSFDIFSLQASTAHTKCRAIHTSAWASRRACILPRLTDNQAALKGRLVAVLRVLLRASNGTGVTLSEVAHSNFQKIFDASGPALLLQF
jgi:hypothetical protein